MSIYRVVIELKSRLVTPLMGDTLFGHILWGIARHKGEEEIGDFIKNLENDPFVVSNAFPHGYLPKPMLINNTYKEANYANIKKIKRIKYIPAQLFFNEEKISSELISKSIDDENVYKSETIERLRNTCNRIIGGTLEEIGLYGVDEIWYTSKNNKITKLLFDLYIISSLKKEELDTYMVWAFENGYGADASIGAGVISVVDSEEVQFPQKGNRAMALGPFVIPDVQLYEALDLRANTVVKKGKIGEELAHHMNPFKKPILFFTEGSTFNTYRNEFSYIGTLIKNIHRDERIVQQGWAPIIRFNEETL